MQESTKPQPEFASLSEDEIMASLNSSDRSDPVAIEVARLVDEYTKILTGSFAKTGKIPAELLTTVPGTEIERIARDIVIKTIQGALKR